ncbi:unnamed protein product [Tenebrio molitor]|nr:unnamed protein product [Tenebrio molitor]
MVGVYPPNKYTNLFRLFSYMLYTFAILPTIVFGFIQLFCNINFLYNDLAGVSVLFLSPKFWLIVRNGHKIKKCIHYFDNEFVTTMNDGHDEIIDKCVKICRRNSLVFFVSLSICAAAWFIKLFLREDISELPLDVWNPFNVNDRSIAYYSLYVSLALGVFYLAFICATIDPLIAGLIHHSTTQLRVLKRNLQYLDEYVENKIVKINFNCTPYIKSRLIYDRIKECVLHYDLILNYTVDLESCFSGVMFSQFMDSITVIGVCCLQISQHNSLTSAIYMSKWYDYTLQSKKALLILMERCKRPVNVTAGKVLKLSLETFILVKHF